VSPPYRTDVRLAEMQSDVLEWYAANGRDLAFRHTTDPWAILVSEVMAQQTQAERAAAAWSGFMDQFPTPAALAAASPATAIRAWRGLGYNRRAVALRAAAIAIVEDHAGRVPDSLGALRELPGIGPYTARAVLAIAFDEPVAALDVNIRRVLNRAFIDPTIDPTAPPLSARAFQSTADRFVPSDHAAAWTHALMDIGAAFCRPRDPRCATCPLQATCGYAARAALEPRPATAARRPSARPSAPRFESTSRWLRGWIVDRLRDAPDDAWVRFAGPIGDHDVTAVEHAIAQLAKDGLIEVDPSSDGHLARFSMAAPTPA
jgi:A/G-specific adenine glycosylase